MIEIQQLTKSYHRKVALDHVTMNIPTGQIVGILGPNGAGKTTLIRILNQIIQPDNGHIRFFGELLKAKHLDQVGYLPEERGLYRTMTIEAHALFLGQLKGMTKKEVIVQLDYWLQKFEIVSWKNKRIEELSKGMAQKIQFIFTVIHEPKLLILDEPLSGFDPINVELIKKELIALKAKGTTILLSTHNMKSVEEICDFAYLMDGGKILTSGTVSSLQEAKKEGVYALKFSGNMIAFVNALWTNFELINKEILGDNRFVAYVRMRGEAGFEDLLTALIGQVKLEAAWEVLPSMHDVFIQTITSREEVTHA
ncbi:MAG: ATP-binding cassette domain-containing protein [Crocinitomicaceae bacterium]|nr:ATP-binding cassette domain-containing protein [Crocinitomicaceae bacterium]